MMKRWINIIALSSGLSANIVLTHVLLIIHFKNKTICFYEDNIYIRLIEIIIGIIASFILIKLIYNEVASNS